MVKSKEICTLTMVRRMAAMLDLDHFNFSEGDLLPPSWHFFLLAGQTKKSDLRKDGFPGLGVPMPDLGLPRLLLGGRTVQYMSNILIGAELEKTSFIREIKEKNSDSGKMAIVTIQHELRVITHEKPAIIETQTYILKELGNNQLGNGELGIRKHEELRDNQLGIRKQEELKDSQLGIRKQEELTDNQLGIRKQEELKDIQLGIRKQEIVPTDNFLIPNSKIPNYTFTPDETLLFQYSALGFNSHKIHIDRDYTQNVEGLPDLVVNGGLTTLLLTEYIRTNLNLKIADIKVKHIAPLYCNKPLTITSEKSESGYDLKVLNDKNIIAIEMEAKIQ